MDVSRCAKRRRTSLHKPCTRFESPEEARKAIEAAPVRAVFNDERKWFEDPETGRVLSGLRPRLRDAFFPHYLAVATNRSSSSASDGTLVDEELTRFARTGRLESRRFTRKKRKRKRKRKKPHPLSRQAVARLEQEGITAVAAQVPVRNGGCATAIDLVGWDAADGALVQVEVKTGMDVGSRSKKMGVLARPFDTLPNAPLSHAYLQAAWAQIAAKASKIPIERSVVLVVNSTKACRKTNGRWHTLPESVTSRGARRALRKGVRAAVRNRAGNSSVPVPPPLHIQIGGLPWSA